MYKSCHKSRNVAGKELLLVLLFLLKFWRQSIHPTIMVHGRNSKREVKNDHDHTLGGQTKSDIDDGLTCTI